MRYLTRTIIVLVVFSLTTASLAPAQTSSEGKIQTFTISGKVGMAGVIMMGLPVELVTDQNGFYSVTVDYGWSGTVTPTKEGYSFVPPSLAFSKVSSNLENQNYTARVATDAMYGERGQQADLFRGAPRSGLYGGLSSTEQADLFRGAPRSGLSGGLSSTDSRRGIRSAGFQPAIGPAGSRKVLVVPAAEVKAQDLAEIIEDMQVMSHILDERFKETRRVQGAFTDFGDFFGRDNRTTEAIYLQGYGVLFSMEVNFAFSPPPKPQDQGAEQTAKNVDSTWQQARRQVFSPGGPRGSRGSDSAEEYNSRMVEELKRDLITTLKHAANVRGVQPDELVILTVIGGGRQSGGGFGGGGFMMGGMGMSGGSAYGGTSSGGMGGSSGYGGGMMSGGMGGGIGGMVGGGMGGQAFGGGVMMGGGMGGSSTTVLTIRTKKSEIDAFAEGELDFEQFKQKVDIFTY